MHQKPTLVRCDNLEEMRKFPDECIDLIATDPPITERVVLKKEKGKAE